MLPLRVAAARGGTVGALLRAAREAAAAEQAAVEAAAAALRRRNDAWRSQRATVDSFEQLVRTQRHVLAAHPTSTVPEDLVPADPRKAIDYTKTKGHADTLASFHRRTLLEQLE